MSSNILSVKEHHDHLCSYTNQDRRVYLSRLGYTIKENDNCFYHIGGLKESDT